MSAPTPNPIAAQVTIAATRSIPAVAASALPGEVLFMGGFEVRALHLSECLRTK